jgi:23S rRNA (cytosine1962-C5)-methyltransferase
MIEFIQPCDFSESQRLFHGRGHAFPELSHVNIDWFEPVILISLYQEVEAEWLAEQVAQLRMLTDKCQSIQVQYRCRKFAPCQ